MTTMTESEKNILHAYIGSSLNYLEFGSGESTIYASGLPTIHTVTSVESSRQFINDFLMQNSDVQNALKNKKLNFHIVDIGETVAWGYPKDEAKKHLWPNYSLSVFNGDLQYDLVLVDGRFRVASTLCSILSTPDACKILIHDFWNRPEYKIVLEFLQVIDKVDTMGVFAKIDSIDCHKVQSIIRKYQYLPGDLEGV
ncbi:hypothetical protein [Dolichospermum sp. UHCC 0259]|uniref:hypothetical protein n=1 Tax=Dolichospermum sp. UHCC 0259 TaxID=2590010 RepID=UPI0014453172|nr:hypothetical protein [Dolichospermum sp. UHCC 0259]MTJ50461.1 hypothetical protein [Dolichospermum sp. UHCC 0259]